MKTSLYTGPEDYYYFLVTMSHLSILQSVFMLQQLVYEIVETQKSQRCLTGCG